MLPVTVVRISSGNSVIRYVLPVLKMTSCLHILERIDQRIIHRRWRTIYLQLFVAYVSALLSATHQWNAQLTVAMCCTFAGRKLYLLFRQN